MKDMNKIILLTLILSFLCGCSYNELPPKTDDITTSYVLPKGVKPTQEELDAVSAAKAEYEASIKK
jgi:hypothetical protein